MTYSIVARDPSSGELGVAVQSQSFNTGAAVPWAWPGVGAIATQSFTDRRYGFRGLQLLAEGASPPDALARLRADDELVEFRQVGVMGADGRHAQWTGVHCVADAGGVAGDDWIAQANMVASPRVWEAMGETFCSETGPLALRLLAALEAAQHAGGDWRGRGGAAIVVVASAGEPWERIVDLRVEDGEGSLAELRRLLELALAYRAANRATGNRREVGQRGGPPVTHVRLLAIVDAAEVGDLERARALLAELEAIELRWRDALRTMSMLPELQSLAAVLEDPRV